MEAREAVEPSIDPLLDPGEFALLKGVDGREILDPFDTPLLLPAGGGADERTISMKRWICKESASNDGCAGTDREIKLFVKRGLEVDDGDSGVRAGARLLKKPSRDDGARDCLDSRAQLEEDEEPYPAWFFGIEDSVEVLGVDKTAGNWY